VSIDTPPWDDWGVVRNDSGDHLENCLIWINGLPFVKHKGSSPHRAKGKLRTSAYPVIISAHLVYVDTSTLSNSTVCEQGRRVSLESLVGRF